MITALNRGPEPADLHLVPQLWFRNLWSWGAEHDHVKEKPSLVARDNAILLQHESLGAGELRFTRASDGTEPQPAMTRSGITWASAS